MATKENPKVSSLFEQWQEEHVELRQFTAELEQWIFAQTKLRANQFRETVTRLNKLNEKLQSHFAREAALCDRMQDYHCPGSEECAAVQRQCDRDHADISNRLKHLIDRMQDAEADQDCWNRGVYELTLIMDIIEQHEEQEAESVCCLLPFESFKPE